ncbi:unnamed protein product [Brassica rapa subsp. narinosa]|uniref:(rape) hypothetical protein n=1 Tax=Brassica napus TaxID=3708 RepID=A0A816K207_BRANA|nr:unnamed protein product [Brassica napus]
MEKNTKKELRSGWLPSLASIFRWMKKSKKEGEATLNGKSFVDDEFDDHPFDGFALCLEISHRPKRTTMADEFSKVKTFSLREVQSNSNSNSNNSRNEARIN